MDKNSLIPFLKQNELFSEFTDSELVELSASIQLATIEKEAFVFKEGDPGEYLYIIVTGNVEIFKSDPTSGKEYRMATLSSQEWFGEMLLFEPGGRTANARALNQAELLLVPLKEFSSFSKGIMNLAREKTHRLRHTTDMAVTSFSEQLKLTKIHDQMGQFIVHLFVLFAFYFYSFKVFEIYNTRGSAGTLISSILITCFAISAIILVKRSHFPLEFYGLHIKNWKKNVRESALFTLPLLLFILLLKWSLITFVPAFKDISLFQIGEPQQSYFYFFHTPSAHRESLVGIALYLLLVPIQEFIARGCLQSVLTQFFTSANKVVLAILTSNLLFGMFHGFKTFTFALAAFAFGLFWGWLYARQKSIVGPSVSHILVGAWAFGALDYQSIFIY